ncbi:MAG: PIG-L family deacetylase [Calditrichia bacterium]
MERVLILSPHTDDAELGCGGTLSKFIEEGKNILWVVFSTAEESLPAGMPKNMLQEEFLCVTKKLGLKKDQYIINNFRVRRLHEKRQEILEMLIQIRSKFKPDLIIGPSLNDFHQDHAIVAREMIRAFKMSSSIICYELPWNHITFTNQLFFRLDKSHIEKKNELLKCYHSQLIKSRSYFSEDFITGLARTRGTQINCDYAEAFEVIRWII